MRVVFDIETNALRNPTKIWCIVCKDLDTNDLSIFRNVVDDLEERKRFEDFSKGVVLWVGHNIVEYDCPIINKLIGISIPITNVLDTLILSRLTDYSRPLGHSIEAYGSEFGLEKIKFNDWTKYSQEMEDYCVRDVEICTRIYLNTSRIINDPAWYSAIDLEHRFQLIVNDLHNNGFAFKSTAATSLLKRVTKELKELDDKIFTAFPPREVLIREFTPKATKFGTISKTSVPRSLWPKIAEYEVGSTYRHTHLVPFNPSSHKQLIEVLNEAGWKPEDRTAAHIDCERAVNLARRSKKRDVLLNNDCISVHLHRLEALKKTGWKINEQNLSTLPKDAPEGARILAKRILLEARRRTLTEWLSLVEDDGRIHGKFVGIGAWTHRMAHQKPNTANIPTAVQMDGSPKLLGKEMRSLWVAPKNRLLVGVDAEGIQLRIFAHYINDPEFTRALVEGRKDDKTDPHSLNQRILGSVCKSRQAAKRFIYALLLGGGLTKLAWILESNQTEAKEALNRLLKRYTGFATLKQSIIPRDGKQGYFVGLDNRKVSLPGDNQRDREHLAMSGYLQNGEAIVIKRSAIIIDEKLSKEKDLKQWMFVDIVHDELQSETKNSMEFSLRIAQTKADAIKEAGEYYNLRCPMAGSFWNDDSKTNTIGTNWYATH